MATLPVLLVVADERAQEFWKRQLVCGGTLGAPASPTCSDVFCLALSSRFFAPSASPPLATKSSQRARI